MIYSPHMAPKIRSERILEAVRGYPCLLKLGTFGGIPCNGRIDPCHYGVIGKGTATKASDLFVIAGCRQCHDLLDRRDPRGMDLENANGAEWIKQIMRGMQHTLSLLVTDGVLTVSDMEIIHSC